MRRCPHCGKDIDAVPEQAPADEPRAGAPAVRVPPQRRPPIQLERAPQRHPFQFGISHLLMLMFFTSVVFAFASQMPEFIKLVWLGLVAGLLAWGSARGSWKRIAVSAGILTVLPLASYMGCLFTRTPFDIGVLGFGPMALLDRMGWMEVRPEGGNSVDMLRVVARAGGMGLWIRTGAVWVLLRLIGTWLATQALFWMLVLWVLVRVREAAGRTPWQESGGDSEGEGQAAVSQPTEIDTGERPRTVSLVSGEEAQAETPGA